jgi:hypothetical protein
MQRWHRAKQRSVAILEAARPNAAEASANTDTAADAGTGTSTGTVACDGVTVESSEPIVEVVAAGALPAGAQTAGA